MKLSECEVTECIWMKIIIIDIDVNLINNPWLFSNPIKHW
jgi:hypothetical protein